MAGPVLYSANPWFATDVAVKYCHGRHFAWVSEYFDADQAPAGSAGALIAPSSNPRKIYEDLLYERLARGWLAAGEINQDQHDDILASVRTPSWRIWRPVLYVIPKHGINAARIKEVRRKDRAAYGPEYQIVDLQASEFDIVDLSKLVRTR
jgi:hypothetical protein